MRLNEAGIHMYRVSDFANLVEISRLRRFQTTPEVCMEISRFSLFKDLPDSPVRAPKASWPRLIKNDKTREHLAGKRISRSALKVELERLCLVWARVQAERRRDAVYDFLEAAYDVVSKFSRSGKGASLLRKLHRLDPALTRIREPYAAVIHHCTDYALDSRTRSKWSRLLRYAEKAKKLREPLDEFVRRNGGINECASRYRKAH